MKTIIYFKSVDIDIARDYNLMGFREIAKLAKSYDDSSPDILYRVVSHIWSDYRIRSFLNEKGFIILSKTEAIALAAILQPDRTIQDHEGNDIPYTFPWSLYDDDDDCLINISNADPLQKKAVLVTMDELNILRNWVTSFKEAVAAATSLGDLQTRVAALPTLNQRDEPQIRTAITNR